MEDLGEWYDRSSPTTQDEFYNSSCGFWAFVGVGQALQWKVDTARDLNQTAQKVG